MTRNLRLVVLSLIVGVAAWAPRLSHAASLRVVVAPPHAPLLPVLQERFLRRHWQARIEQRERVDRAEPTTQTMASDAAVVKVFIDLQTPGWARLVFVQPGGERFTIRDLRFAQGLNEVARETIGFVVDSAVDSLFAGLQFELSRNDAEVALQKAPTPVAPEPVTPPARPASPVSVPVPVVRPAAAVVRENAIATPTPARWSRYVGAGYSASAAGTSGLAWLAGPSLLLGQHSSRTQTQLEVGWLMSTPISGDVVAGDVWGAGGRASGGWRWSRGAFAFALLPVRVGVEVLRVNPEAQTTGATAASAQTLVSPLMGAAAGVSWRVGGGITFMAFIAADVDLRGTRFTAQNSGTTQTVADVWRVRPCATLAVAWGH